MSSRTGPEASRSARSNGSPRAPRAAFAQRCQNSVKHDQCLLLPVAPPRILHGAAVPDAQLRRAHRSGAGADDSRPARRIGEDPRRSGQWRCRAVALCRLAHSPARLALPPLPGSRAWLLDDVRIYDANMNFVRHAPRLTGLQGVTPAQLTIAKVDPTVLDYWTLKRRIAELEAAGRPADEPKAGLAHKISGPVSTLLMPLLAAVAAFGLARSGQVLLRAVIGMALGFAYFVVDNFSLAMGNAGTYPALVAAWAPFLLFLLIGETVLIRTEE